MSAAKRLICVITVLFSLAFITSCDMPTCIVGSIPDPEKSVAAFFDCVCKGDFKEADNYLDGVSVSMRYKVEGDFSRKLYRYLLKSYSYELGGDFVSDFTEASGKVDFTSLDFRLLSSDLKEASTKLGKRYLAERNEDYTVENNGVVTLSDEGAEKIAAEALDAIMTQPEKYYAARTFDLSLRYNGSQWKIDISDELFNAICGEFQAEKNE